MAKYCPNCGNLADDNAAFCTKCGSAIQKEENNTYNNYNNYNNGYTNMNNGYNNLNNDYNNLNNGYNNLNNGYNNLNNGYNNLNNGYNNPNGNQPPMQNTSTPKAALVLGILGIVFAWLFALVGHVLSIIGIVIGNKEKKTMNYSTGLTLSIIGEVCAAISSILGIILNPFLY